MRSQFSYLFLRIRDSFTIRSYIVTLISTNSSIIASKNLHVEEISYSDISYPSIVCAALFGIKTTYNYIRYSKEY